MNDILRQRLLALDSCALSDAMDSAGLPAAVTGLLPLSVRRRIVGQALTVRLSPERPAGASARHLGTSAIAAAAGGEIIVIEHSSGVECAGWGGVLSTGAQLNGVCGVVIDGLARDIDEAIDLDFPIYGRGATARTARGRVWEHSTNQVIRIGESTVEPGDWVLADSSGVIFLPRSRAEEIVERATTIMRRERLMVQALREGGVITEVLGRDYEDMLHELD
jgi:4-hydroxy-4-methyl-2-oxoglutarate aldolase